MSQWPVRSLVSGLLVVSENARHIYILFTKITFWPVLINNPSTFRILSFIAGEARDIWH